MFQVDDISRVVEQAGRDLSRALDTYWPAAKKNNISERNVSLYLNVAFRRAGFVCLCEANPEEKTRIRLDLIAVHEQERIAVCVECKRLFRASGCREMLKDMERIRGFSPIRRRGDYKPKFGVLAAVTMKDRIYRWWGQWQRAPSSNDQWQQLCDAVSSARTGKLALSQNNNGIYIYLLYVVFNLDGLPNAKIA